jgi:erythromycin esterase
MHDYALQMGRLMKRVFSFVFLGLLAVVPISVLHADDPGTIRIVNELRARAIPFNTVMPKSGFDDLAAFDQIIGDARIVALGESTHGTAEFFRMKHRLFEYLVEKKGFTVFAFETPWPDVEIVNHYVQTGEGFAAGALSGLYPVWRTQEVYDLIEWMRAYNSTPGRAKLLSFTGFDTFSATMAANARCVIEAMSRLGAADGDIVRRLYSGAETLVLGDTMLSSTRPSASVEELARLQAGAADAFKLVEERQSALRQLLTAAEVQRVRQCARTARYSSDYDKVRADNVTWLANEAFRGEKIALWAHNSHLAADTQFSMAGHLRATFGRQMLIIGFSVDRGQVRAVRSEGGKPISGPWATLPLAAANPGAVDGLLHATGLPRFIVDLRAVSSTSPLGDWIRKPQPMRAVGWTHDPDHPDFYYSYTLSQAFDALIFIKEGTAATPR